MEEQDKFYYVSFVGVCCEGVGHYSIRQRGGNGFNIAGAHQYLIEKFKHIIVINFWQEIPKNHHEGFRRYAAWLLDKCADADKKGLTLIKGEGTCTPPKGELKPVP